MVLTRTAARQVVTLATVAGLALGCGGDDSPGARTRDPATTTAAPSPTDSPSPSAQPAAGKPLPGPTFTARAPRGWKVERGGSSTVLSTIYAADVEPDGNVVGFLRIADGSAFVYDPLARLARQRAHSSQYQKAPEILETVYVDSVEMYHVAGAVGRGNHVIDLGAIVGKNLVEIHIESDARTPEELQAVLDSILATWRWR